MLASIRRRATGRNVLFAILLALVLGRVVAWVMVPAYRTVASGFVPFDLQPRLTRAMVAIQRGAFSSGVEFAYARYAIVDVLHALASAVAVAISWSWLMTNVAHPTFTALDRFGLLLLPYLAALCAMVENVGFSVMILTDPRHLQFDLTGTTLAIHHLKFMLLGLAKGVTVALVAFAAYVTYRRMYSPPPPDTQRDSHG